MAFTIRTMREFALEAWGPFGGTVVDAWSALNDLYFDGKLKPVPLVLTNAQPFGRRLAFCSYGSAGRTITLNVPKQSVSLVADNGTLLHEMVHQALSEAGEDTAHSSGAWRREIMRLHRQITRGEIIWAGRSTTKRDPLSKRVIRYNEPGEAGLSSITQGQIAAWPQGFGFSLGKLGATPRHARLSK